MLLGSASAASPFRLMQKALAESGPVFNPGRLSQGRQPVELADRGRIHDEAFSVELSEEIIADSRDSLFAELLYNEIENQDVQDIDNSFGFGHNTDRQFEHQQAVYRRKESYLPVGIPLSPENPRDVVQSSPGAEPEITAVQTKQLRYDSRYPNTISTKDLPSSPDTDSFDTDLYDDITPSGLYGTLDPNAQIDSATWDMIRDNDIQVVESYLRHTFGDTRIQNGRQIIPQQEYTSDQTEILRNQILQNATLAVASQSERIQAGLSNYTV